MTVASFPDCTGAMLAGGHSSRMGSDKRLLEVNGASVLQRTLDLLSALFPELLVIGPPPPTGTAAAGTSVRWVPDTISGAGPLGGIHAALLTSTTPIVFVVACDMPFVSAAFIEREMQVFAAEGCEALIPTVGGFIEPLHAVYRADLAPRLAAFLRNHASRSIRDFLATVRTVYWRVEETPEHYTLFDNINTPEDLERVRSGARGAHHGGDDAEG